MYIKPKVIGASMILAASAHAIDFSAHINVGMSSNPFQLLHLNHMNTNQLTDYRSSILNHYRVDVANSIGYNMPEFMDVYAFGDFSPLTDVSIQPYINAKLLDYRVDFGVESSYTSHFFNDAVHIKGYLNAYHSLFVKEINYTESVVNVDAGTKIDVSMTPNFSVYLELKQPLVTDFELQIDECHIPVRSIPNVAIGASVNILGDYGFVLDNEEPVIIQEPISIPVIEINIEEPVAEEIVPESIIESPQLVIDEEPEELGWFAWIIEFIAKLFRF